MYLYETYMPLLSLLALQDLGLSVVYFHYECIVYTAMYVRPHNQSFESNHSLPESMVPPIISSLGKFVTGSTSIPKRLPKQLDDTTWTARCLTFHSTSWPKGGRTKNWTDQFPLPYFFQSYRLKMFSVSKCRDLPNDSKYLFVAHCKEVTGVVMLHVSWLPILPCIAFLSIHSCYARI